MDAAVSHRWGERLRPYAAAFGSRFSLMLQYRSAALAGFATQCWWGGIKVMVLAAFFRGSTAPAAMTLAEVITYTWVAQALFVLLPWTGDPEVAAAVRSGSVAYDRLRPVDCYALWFARAAGWLVARALPRAGLMLAMAALLLPLVGLGDWAWRPPASIAAGAFFAASLVLAVLLAAAIVVLINVAVLSSLDERGINLLMIPLILLFSGNMLPLLLFPDAVQALMRWQPLAGLLDIPLCLYFGHLAGVDAWAALMRQAGWIAVAVVAGRLTMARTMRALQVQGG
jgi:ABC-2 type transport system permease protein